MTEDEHLQEMEEEIQFLLAELDELLLESGILSERRRLAIWTNINRIKFLRRRILELKSE